MIAITKHLILRAGNQKLDPGTPFDFSDAEFAELEKMGAIRAASDEEKQIYAWTNPGRAAAAAQQADAASDDGDEDADQTTEPVAIEDMSREELKLRADDMGIDYAKNIPTDKLIDLIREAEEDAVAGEEQTTTAGPLV
jgi:hypothetical protein